LHTPAKVLICIRNPDTLAQIKSLLAGHGYNETLACSTASQALRIADTMDIDIAILGWSFIDGNALFLAHDLQQKWSCSVLILVPEAQESYARQHTSGNEDMICLTKPVRGSLLLQTLEMMNRYRSRVTALQQDVVKLQKDLERRSIAEKAKVLLMKKENMTEAQAWKYLQKTSMNQGKPLAEVAKEIIDSLRGE